MSVRARDKRVKALRAAASRLDDGSLDLAIDAVRRGDVGRALALLRAVGLDRATTREPSSFKARSVDWLFH